jgi:hypothetical protein
MVTFNVSQCAAKRQLEFNQLMLAFYQTGDQKPMNAFLRSCLDDQTLKIMAENQSEENEIRPMP